MPTYDTYEDTLALSNTHDLGEGHDGVQTLNPSPVLPIPLGQPGNPILEPGVPVKNDGIDHIQAHNNDPFHMMMPSHTHVRKSSLIHEDSVDHSVPTKLIHPASLDTSSHSLNAEERASLAKYSKAQSDNESIRLALACERCGEDLNRKNQVNDPNEFVKEAYMLNGGWMHRSQASCELLNDRPAREMYETQGVEALRARMRDAL